METPRQKAIWRNTDHDEPVTVVGELGEIDGVRYFAIAESVAGIPETEIFFIDSADQS